MMKSTIRLTFLILGGGLPLPLAAQTSVDERVIWPLPPEAPRVEYVGYVISERDVGKRPSLLGRLSRSLAGSRDALLGIDQPLDVYVSPEGRIFVTNGREGAVRVFDPVEQEGRVLVPNGLAHLGKAMGIDGDDRGTLFVADPRARRVVAFDETGEFVAAYGGTNQMLNPVDVAVSPEGDRIYVADSYLHQLIIYAADGTELRRVGRHEGDIAAKTERNARRGNGAHGRGDADTSDGDTATAVGPTPGHDWTNEPSDMVQNRSGLPGEFKYPAFVTVGADGAVFVSDGLNFRVQAFDRDGEFLHEFGGLGDGPGAFARPKGLAVDSQGHVYVVDAAFNNVQMFDGDGQLLLAFGGMGTGSGQLWLPIGIAVDASDRVFVADRYNNRLQVYQFLPTSTVGANNQ